MLLCRCVSHNIFMLLPVLNMQHKPGKCLTVVTEGNVQKNPPGWPRWRRACPCFHWPTPHILPKGWRPETETHRSVIYYVCSGQFIKNEKNWFKTYSWSLCTVTPPPFIVFPRVLREDAAAHLGVDVEVPVALKVSLLALCIVEQEAVFDDEESLYRGRQWKQQWVNPVGLKGTNVVLRTERWDF